MRSTCKIIDRLRDIENMVAYKDKEIAKIQ